MAPDTKEITAEMLDSEKLVSEDVQKKLANLYKKYQQLNEHEKKSFHNEAIDLLMKTVRKPKPAPPPKTWLMTFESYIPFIFAASCMTILFVMGARRLYKYMQQREQRQLEKKVVKLEKAKAKLLKMKKKNLKTT